MQVVIFNFVKRLGYRKCCWLDVQMHSSNATPFTSLLSVCDLMNGESEAQYKLEEQHIFFQLGKLQPSGNKIEFYNFR